MELFHTKALTAFKKTVPVTGTLNRNFPLKQLHVTLQRILQQEGKNHLLNA